MVKYGAKGSTKKISIFGAPTRPTVSSPSSNSSTSSLILMRAIKACRSELNFVNNSHVQLATKSGKFSNASKVKVEISLFRSPRRSVASNESHYHTLPNKILGSEKNKNNTMFGNFVKGNHHKS